MSVPLYTDHNIRRAVVEGLRRRDVDVLTAREDGAAERRDEWLLERATRLGRALFSQDRDLPRIANRWLREGRDFAGLIYCQQNRLSVRETIENLDLIAGVLDPAEMHNHIEFIPV